MDFQNDGGDLKRFATESDLVRPFPIPDTRLGELIASPDSGKGCWFMFARDRHRRVSSDLSRLVAHHVALHSQGCGRLAQPAMDLGPSPVRPFEPSGGSERFPQIVLQSASLWSQITASILLFIPAPHVDEPSRCRALSSARGRPLCHNREAWVNTKGVHGYRFALLRPSTDRGDHPCAAQTQITQKLGNRQGAMMAVRDSGSCVLIATQWNRSVLIINLASERPSDWVETMAIILVRVVLHRCVGSSDERVIAMRFETSSPVGGLLCVGGEGGSVLRGGRFSAVIAPKLLHLLRHDRL